MKTFFWTTFFRILVIIGGFAASFFYPEYGVRAIPFWLQNHLLTENACISEDTDALPSQDSMLQPEESIFSRELPDTEPKPLPELDEVAVLRKRIDLLEMHMLKLLLGETAGQYVLQPVYEAPAAEYYSPEPIEVNEPIVYTEEISTEEAPIQEVSLQPAPAE